MDRSARFVAFAVVAALLLGAWRVAGSGGRVVPIDRVPIIAGGEIVQIGGALVDFDLAGDRLIAAFGTRVVVGQLGERDAWSITAVAPAADDGVRDVDLIAGRWAAVLRGRQLCAVDVRADGPIAWDRCHRLPLPAVHAVCEGAWCAVELSDGAVAVLGVEDGIWRSTEVVARPAVGYSGFAVVGDALAVIEPDDRVCAYALPAGAPLGCGERAGVTGLYGVGNRLAAYAAGTMAFDDVADIASGPAATLPLHGPTDSLAGGHGVLAVQQGGSLTLVDADDIAGAIARNDGRAPDGRGAGALAELGLEAAEDGSRTAATTFSIEGRLGSIASSGERTCWSRMLGSGDRAFGGIRCVDRASGAVTLSLVSPGIVEHALQLDGRLVLVDATAGVGLVDVAAGTIELLADGALLRQAHGLAVDEEAVAVAMGQDGFGLLQRPLERLNARSLAWRNAEAARSIGIGIDGQRVIAADADGAIVVADRRTGATTQRFETGGYPLEVLPTDAGVFVGNRDHGLMLMRRTAAGMYACCETVLAGAVSDIALSGDRLAIARGDDGVSIASPADAASGRAAGTTVPTVATALGVAWSGEQLIVAEADGHVEVFDAPAGGPVVSRGRRWVGGTPERVWKDGSGLVVASEMGGVSLVRDVASLALAANTAPPAADAGIALYAPDALAAAIASGEVMVLDVRRPDEFAESHIPGAHSVPLADVPRFLAQHDLGAATVVPYCLKDFRGYDAIRLLQQSGVARVGAIDGFGLAAWKAATLPLAGTLPGQDDAAALDALRRVVEER